MDSPDVWYADGLRFGCTRCNLCCTGEPGYVWVGRNRADAITDFLGLPVRAQFEGHSLVPLMNDGDYPQDLLVSKGEKRRP